MTKTQYKPEGYCADGAGDCTYTTASLERAISKGQIIEARASLCDENMAISADLGCMRGIIPKEEVAFVPDGSPVKDIAAITRVGKSVCFKVREFSELHGERVALLSRRDAQIECLESFLLKSTPGDIIDARVTHLEPFGAFVDIGCGIISLLSIDSISVSRISHPRDRLYPGMFIKTVIKSIDRETSRIAVTHRELLGTWLENAEKFRIGQTVPGIVRSIEPYGIFIELAPNLAGLAEYSEGISVGQSATVYIKNIIPEKMKVKLVLVDTYPSEETIPEHEYFFSEEHLSAWRYSPEGCQKLIETVFDA